MTRGKGSFGAEAGRLGSEVALPLLPAALNWQTFPRRSAGRPLAECASELFQRHRLCKGALMTPEASALSGTPREAIRRWGA